MNTRQTFSKFKKSLIQSFKKLFYKEILVDGQEPPKSYAFEKKFAGIYAIFLFYSFLILFAINYPNNVIVQILTLGNPFAFGNAIIGLFLILSFLYSNDKFRIFIFEKVTLIKQTILYIGIFLPLNFIFTWIYNLDVNLMSFLLALSTFWLILLSTRFYMYSRKFATKIESRLISKYSLIRNFGAFLTPYFILGVLITLALFYRSLLVFLSLDFFGPFAPEEAVEVYLIEMRLVMPLIYFSLILTLMFILFEFIFTRTKAETKRAALYDNYTFSLIVLFIFFFQILQVSIYLILHEATIDALKASVGATSATVTYIFVFEFVLSIFFLYRIITRLGRTLGWRLLIFKKDGLITLILGFVFAQTLSRYALQTQIPNQSITVVGQYFMADKYIVSIMMIIFLGVTLLVYYLKPQETSMFIRLQKETVSKEERDLDIVYKLIKSEYIRRGDAYPIEILERELLKATQHSKEKVYSIIYDLAKKDMDIEIFNAKDGSGKVKKFIDFVSVTEKFDRKGVANQKAQKYLSKRLYDTMSKSKQRTISLSNNRGGTKASDQFINSLSSTYTKKIKEEKHQMDKKMDFTMKQLPDTLKTQILELLRNEYIYRMENNDKYPDFHFPISEIASRIQLETRITPGELYPILENLNKNDIEFELIDNPEETEDKLISFFPIADDDMNNSLMNFRNEEYMKIRARATSQFFRFFKRKRAKATLGKLNRHISKDTEESKAWHTLLNRLNDYFQDFSEIREKLIHRGDMKVIIDKFQVKKNK
ncbi:MAG: hypothetical protein EU533_03045 [Promethearchaeota archaeon]|nr:MAG: hypothetical protein EU533_03045 [Candidatus Lokiarchaeota archaeon]